MTKAKAVMSQENVDKLLAEKMNEYMQDRTAWICLENGYTYIGYNICDITTRTLMGYLKNLISLMGVEYSIKPPFGEDETYYLILDGEDKVRANFIQRFLDNGYKLSW